MSVPNLQQVLVNETNRISPEIYRRKMHKPGWSQVVINSWFPKGMGDTIRAMVYERSLPSSDPVWTPVRLYTGDGNSCVPTAHTISPAQTLREYGLDRTAVESDPICVDDIRSTMEVVQQVGNVVDNLTEQVDYIWENRKRDEYIRIAENKVIFNDAFATGTATFPLTVPQYGPSQKALDWVYQRLSRDFHMEGASGVDNGAPVYIAFMSMEASDIILRSDANNRQDFRDSDRRNELLRAMGINRVFRGFAHMIDNFCPRYNFVGGAWVRVSPYITVSATNGDKSILNPAYLTAEFEDIVVFNSKVYQCEYPEPVSSVAGATFNQGPETYRGTYTWRNHFDKTINPDETWGYWRGVLTQGSRPITPEAGYTVRVRRCDPEGQMVFCS